MSDAEDPSEAAAEDISPVKAETPDKEAGTDIEAVEDIERDTSGAWAGINLLASRMQAVPYASAFLSQFANLMLRAINNKVNTHPAWQNFQVSVSIIFLLGNS